VNYAPEYATLPVYLASAAVLTGIAVEQTVCRKFGADLATGIATHKLSRIVAKTESPEFCAPFVTILLPARGRGGRTLHPLVSTLA
jgi:hypothetical protein